ncbi:MAG TPA: 50S ribosomal protein L13 [Anaerolineales bacterium]|nr:50S ribosomal protein L13 [Anaerolineales bacterium]HRQ92796.1 50S ribosomal protein L13 [Anaerolineales bacterium]
MQQKSYYPKPGDVEAQWYIVDAAGKNLGRLASQIANVLLGKHRPEYTPGVDLGDAVIVTNCGQITVTGAKLTDKIYYRYSGYQSGLKETTLRRLLETHPDRVIYEAVWGMLPHNKLGRQLIKKLKIYAGTEHPHEAQKPQPLAVK